MPVPFLAKSILYCGKADLRSSQCSVAFFYKTRKYSTSLKKEFVTIEEPSLQHLDLATKLAKAEVQIRKSCYLLILLSGSSPPSRYISKEIYLE